MFQDPRCLLPFGPAQPRYISCQPNRSQAAEELCSSTDSFGWRQRQGGSASVSVREFSLHSAFSLSLFDFPSLLAAGFHLVTWETMQCVPLTPSGKHMLQCTWVD